MADKTSMTSPLSWKLILARVLIGLVVFFNLQSAILFILHAETYAPSFELSGVAGLAMIRGMGILFLMWNIPYLFALWNPLKNRVSLIEACLMQLVGVVGESILFTLVPASHLVLRSSGLRFIAFDAFGLLALCAALWITRPANRKVGLQPR